MRVLEWNEDSRKANIFDFSWGGEQRKRVSLNLERRAFGKVLYLYNLNYLIQNMSEGSFELKGSPLLEVVPIDRRANCKIVTLNQRQFLIGGMTAEAITNLIYEFRLNHQYVPARIEWKEVHFDNNLFSPRNSFAACGGNNMIYIWGGLEMGVNEQTILSDLIEIDVEKGKMRTLPLKQKIGIHSSALSYDSESNELVAYGGTDADSNMPAFIYRLKLDQAEVYEWIRVSVNCPLHQGYIWQHSSTLSRRSFFNGIQGKFLTVVGGCRFPHSPYKAIVEIDLVSFQVTHNLSIEQALVSHDSVQREGRLYIFGGSNGGDFNSIIFVLHKGKIIKLNGHRAIGCSCCIIEQKSIIVYGGVCGPTSINGAFIYQ